MTRAGRVDVLEPDETGAPNRWRMRKPIDAPADSRTVTQIVAVLANLRAEGFVSDNQKDPARFGLDHPLIEVEWETDKPHRLKVGGQVPREAAYYATTDDQQVVFTLSTDTLKPFEAEFRDHLIMSFPLARAERMVLTWSRPNRTVAFRHREPTTKGQVEWVGEPGSDSGGIDLSALTALGEGAFAPGGRPVLAIRRRDPAVHRTGSSPPHGHRQVRRQRGRSSHSDRLRCRPRAALRGRGNIADRASVRAAGRVVGCAHWGRATLGTASRRSLLERVGR